MINPRTLDTFEGEAAELPVGDWTAHRDLAQEAVEAGYAAELTQEVSNDVGDAVPMTHALRFLEPDAVVAFGEGIHESEDAMGGSVSVEQFTPDRPHGFYGQRTPLGFSPVQDDWPDTANIRLSHGETESVHSTLTQALETVLREQNDLAWIPPKNHTGFHADGGLHAGNDLPLLLHADGSLAAEHVLDAFRAAATETGQRITVATGREDIGSVFKADFAPNGSWSLGTFNATARNEVEGSGPMPARHVTREFSDALETHAERDGRESRSQERRAYEASRPDAQALGSLGQVLKNRPPAGVKTGLNSGAHASSQAHGDPRVDARVQGTGALRDSGIEK